MNETPKRIHLLGSGRHEEAVAGGAIKPGHLIALNTDEEVVVHSVIGGAAEKAFALEDALQGRGIDTDYAADELVGYVLASPGDVVYAWLDAGEDVDTGDFLVSAGNGRLEAASSTYVRLAVALEAKDLSDTGAAPARIRIRVL